MHFFGAFHFAFFVLEFPTLCWMRPSGFVHFTFTDVLSSIWARQEGYKRCHLPSEGWSGNVTVVEEVTWMQIISQVGVSM